MPYVSVICCWRENAEPWYTELPHKEGAYAISKVLSALGFLYASRNQDTAQALTVLGRWEGTFYPVAFEIYSSQARDFQTSLQRQQAVVFILKCQYSSWSGFWTPHFTDLQHSSSYYFLTWNYLYISSLCFNSVGLNPTGKTEEFSLTAIGIWWRPAKVISKRTEY